MILRSHTHADLNEIACLQGGDFDWLNEPGCEEIQVALSDSGEFLGAVGAWKRAEVHLLLNPLYASPSERLSVVNTLHASLEQSLASKGYGRAWTWFENMRAWGRRMRKLGWVSTTAQSWHRRIG